jgi:hypothetical protein
MFEIAMTVCLAANINVCKPVSLTFADEAVTAVQCQMGIAGQAEIAKWAAGHPNWKPMRWRCQPAGLVANI